MSVEKTDIKKLAFENKGLYVETEDGQIIHFENVTILQLEFEPLNIRDRERITSGDVFQHKAVRETYEDGKITISAIFENVIKGEVVERKQEFYEQGLPGRIPDWVVNEKNK